MPLDMRFELRFLVWASLEVAGSRLGVGALRFGVGGLGFDGEVWG